MGARGPVLTVAGLGVVAAAAALGLVLGAGPGDGAAAAPSAETSAAPPAARAGTWAGPLRERGGPTVDVRLTLENPAVAGPRAPQAATLDIPALGCRYTGTVADPDLTAAVVTLRATDDPQALCADRATVRLTALSGRTLRYELLRTCDHGAGCTRRDTAALLLSLSGDDARRPTG